MLVGLDDLRVAIDQLAADTQGPLQVAKLAELTSNLTKAGLRKIIAETIQHDADPEQAVKALDLAWYASIVDYIRWTDQRCDVAGGPSLTAAVTDFQLYDATHLARNAERICRYAARRARDAQDTHPDQASLVKKEAGKARRHMPLRDLLSRAPDVMLALKPCWATSPIVVSQVLPLRQLFDVVIFDEASQVRQADAIPSIIRARQVVVTGDTKQLTPTDFFSSVAGDDDEYSSKSSAEAGASSLARTGDEFDSILESLGTLLPEARLTWHYRSRDERLIAFSNKHFYKSSLTTFPGVGTDVCLTHVIAESGQQVAGQEQSSAAEVERVVELMIEHAETRPEVTLGVITLGTPHMNRIEAKLQSVLRDRPDLSAFFDPDGEEPYFIKNLERVQGDERDAIILSVGYGKRADNRIDYRWGPLTRPGGERRLNVAVTRAKIRLTLVTSFRTEELDPSRFQNEGGKLLCAYLAYVDSAGRDVGSMRDETLELNPFEQDVLEKLGSAGISVISQYGVGDMRIDFAARHPELPGRMVLAIEADGASYHSSGAARDRDRLRQQHLERLGWRFHRIWSTDWFTDPDAEIAKVRAAYERAATDSDGGRREPGSVPPAHSPEAGDGSQRSDCRPPRPRIRQGLSIDGYSATELNALARWIESDGRLRTQEDVAEEMRSALGLSRRGPKIDQRLRAAIAVVRDSALGKEGAQ
jgi:very-short-patch-repair endonuclease